MRPQVPLDRSERRKPQTRISWNTPTHPSSSDWKSREEKPKTLGSILVNSHGALNEIVDFEAYERNRNGNQYQLPSMTSSEDMARARSYSTRGSEEEDEAETRYDVDAEDQRYEESRDLPEVVWQEQASDRHYESREVEADPRYWEDQHDEMRGNHTTSAFQAIDYDVINSLPRNALADDLAPTSPQNGNEAPIQCHSATTGLAVSAAKKPTTKSPKSPFGRGFFDLWSSNNFFPQSCTSAIPEDDDNAKPGSASIWALLDSNEEISDNEEDTSFDQHEDRRASSKTRRGGRQTDFRPAYEDLMFMNSSPRAHKSPRRQRPRKPPIDRINPHRSVTPSTIGTRSTQTSHTPNSGRKTPQTMRSQSSQTPPSGRQTPQRMYDRPSPTPSQIREDLWGNDDIDRSRTSTPTRQPTPDRNYRRPRTASNRSESTAPSGIPPRPRSRPRSNTDFDPFDLAGQDQAHSEPTPKASNQNQSNTFHRLDCAKPQAENQAQSSKRRVLAPSKKDTKPTYSQPKQETDEKGFGLVPDFYMLEALQKEWTKGVPTKHSSRLKRRAEHSEPRTNRVPDSVSEMEKEQQKQQQRMDLLKWKSKNNVEKLKRLAMIQQEAESKGSSFSSNVSEQNEVYAAASEDSNAHSVARKPLVKEVEGLSKTRSEDFSGHYMYVAYSRFGPSASKVLQLCEHQYPPDPNTKAGEVLIEVLVSGISTTDCAIRRGGWTSIKLNPYIIPGVGFVGKVRNARGKKRGLGLGGGFKDGDKVISLVKQGANARFTVLSKDQLVKVPRRVQNSLAVCLTETYLTAFQALHVNQRGALRYRDNSLKGQSVLILGGGTTLGLALIEVAIAGGVEFCYGLAKDRQFEAVNTRGGVPLPRDPQEWLTLIGRQIDLMVVFKDRNGMYSDPISREHLKALKADGQIVFIGPPGTKLDPSLLASGNQHKLICKSNKGNLNDRSHIYNVFESWDSNLKLAKKDLEHLLSLLDRGFLQPEVLEKVPLSKVAKVQEILENKRITGHIVCTPWSQEPHQQYAASSSVRERII